MRNSQRRHRAHSRALSAPLAVKWLAMLLRQNAAPTARYFTGARTAAYSWWALIASADLRSVLLTRTVTFSITGLIAMLGSLTVAHADEPAREYRIKAAYLYNLSKFIEWPEEKAQEGETSFTICVYGQNPFADSLEKLREHTVKGRSIAIRYVAENQPIEGCQLVFQSRANPVLPKALSSASGNAPILSVGDDKNFLDNGGIVCLLTENNNVLLDINLTRAKQIGFNISANLLEIAHKIQ